MKTRIFLLSLFFGLAISFGHASAALDCIIDSPLCPGGYTQVFSMSGTSNAHAAADGSYDYKVCCRYEGDIVPVGTECGERDDPNVVLRLAGATNTHVQIPAVQANLDVYDTDVCLSGGVAVSCMTTTPGPGDCSDLDSGEWVYECLSSVSAETNAHVGSCTGAYEKKVCCAMIVDLEGPGILVTSVDSDTELPYETKDSAPVVVVSTVESADCRISDDPNDQVYDDMEIDCIPDGPKEEHTCNSPAFGEDGEKELYVICKDGSGNEGSRTVAFSLDTTPPGILGDTVEIDGDTEAAYLTDNPRPVVAFMTGEDSLCRVSFTEESYDDMDTECGGVLFTDSHICFPHTVDGNDFSEGDHTVYFACTDEIGNSQAVPTSVTFTVDTAGPVITVISVDGDTDSDHDEKYETSDSSPEIIMTVTDPAQISGCRTSLIDEPFDSMDPANDCTYDGGDQYTCISPDAGGFGEKTAYIACEDEAGNEGGGSIIFEIGPCLGESCGAGCTSLGGEDGVCDGTGTCYTEQEGGGCGLGCSVPDPGGGIRVCHDYLGNPDLPCDDENFGTKCGDMVTRSGATRCGDNSVCKGSFSAGSIDCCPPTGCITDVDKVVVIEGGWDGYTLPVQDEFYGPDKPIPIIFSAPYIKIDDPEVLESNFFPLFECQLRRGDGSMLYLDQWISIDENGLGSDITLTPPEEHLNDGEWTVRCGMHTDFSLNSGWLLSDGGTPAETETVSFNVDTVDPVSWITEPASGSRVGELFTLGWTSDDLNLDCYDVERCVCQDGNWIAEETCTQQTQKELNLPFILGPDPRYCFRVRAHDKSGNTGDWSCDPGSTGDTALCDDVELDYDEPDEDEMWINTSPAYVNASSASLDLIWNVDDDENIQCYRVRYMITDEKAAPGEEVLQDWTEWTGIYDLSDVRVCEGGTPSFVSCTSGEQRSFIPSAVMGSDEEGRTYNFSVRAIDDAVGCSNMNGWVDSAGGSAVDRTPPAVFVSALRSDDRSVIGDGGEIRNEAAIFSVKGDPSGNDYSGVNESWVVYTVALVDDDGSLIEIKENKVRYDCGSGLSECEFEQFSWQAGGDYNVTLEGFARDRAGNVQASGSVTFHVRGVVGTVSSIKDLYLTLGSYEHVAIKVVNRQDIKEEMELTIDEDVIEDNYPYAKLLPMEGGSLSLDEKTLTFEILPRETQTVDMIVYTSRPGNFELTFYVNSTTHYDVSSSGKIGVTVAHPAEFPGLSWPSVVLLLALSALVYSGLGARLQKRKKR